MTYTTEFNEQFNIAEIQISYKTGINMQKRPQIHSSKDAHQIFRHSWNDETIELFEEFKVICLSHSNRILGIWESSKGSKCATVVEVSHLMAVAILTNSSSIMLAHNHPSGNLKPSSADEKLTKQIQTASKYHSIKLLDHIILSYKGYFSFADEGIL